MKLVTIVIPTYKRPVYLKRAIYSAINQTYQDIEVIVVDDNDPGTDDRYETEAIMQQFISDSRINFLQHDKNRNGSAARNTGWRHARGEYITFLDDDDEIAPEKIKKQIECLEKLDTSWGACYTGYHILKPNNKIQISAEKRQGYLYIEALMRTLFMGSGSNLLIRKSVVDEVGGFDETFVRNQDIEFLARVLEHYKLFYVNEDLLTIHLEVRQFQRTFQQIEEVTEYYLEKFNDRLNAIDKEKRQRILIVISLERSRIATQFGEFKKAYQILLENNVTLWNVLRYIWYLLERVILQRSYGFYL